MDWLFAYMLPEVAEQWDYAMITLIVRFIGVFVVMAIMQIALQASARVVRSVERRRETREQSAPDLAPAPAAPAPVERDTAPVQEPGLDDPTIAAIGLALALESRQSVSGAPSSGPSAWSTPWRIRELPRSRGR